MGKNGSFHPLSSFRYDYRKGNYKNISHVHGPRNERVTYLYDKETQRPLKTIHCSSQGEHTLTTLQEWDDTKLSSKSVIDDQGKLLWKRTLTYDDRGNVLQETLMGKEFEKQATKYTYHNDLPIKIAHPNGLIEAFEYLPNTPLVTRYTANDEETINSYNCDNILISTRKRSPIINSFKEIELEDGKPSIITEGYDDKILKITHYLYNAQNLPIQESVYDADGNLAYTLERSYDLAGRLTSETTPLGQKATYTYDALGNKIHETRCDGLEIEYTYDRANRLIAQTQHGEETRKTTHRYDLSGNCIATTNHLGDTTTYAYDEFGRQIKETLPNGGVIKKAYDAAGNCIEVTNPLGHTTRRVYDGRGNCLQTIHADATTEINTYTPTSQLASSIDASGVTTNYTYDTRGNLISKKTLGRETTYRYEGKLCTAKTDPAGNTTKYFYDGAGRKIREEFGERITSYAYDPLGRLYSTQTGNRISISLYDLLDRIIEERIEDLDGALLALKSFSYDAAGNQTEVITCPHNKPAIEKTTFDAYRRPIQKANQLGEVTLFLYEAKTHRILDMTSGIEKRISHDTMGNVITSETLSSTGDTLSHQLYKYDLAGNLISQVSNHTSAIEFEYDKMNRLICQKERDRLTRYHYDLKGQLLSTIKPDGTTIQFSYDTYGNISTVTAPGIAYSYIHDPLDQIIEANDQTSATSSKYTYDQYGNVLFEKLMHGLTLTKTYDIHGRITMLSTPSSQTQYIYDAANLLQVDDFHYTYDLAGNVLSLKTPIDERTFTYDRLSRPITFHNQKKISYDSRGNITSINNDQYAYSDLDQLEKEEGHTYTYNPLHNRISRNDKVYPANQDITENLI